MKNMTLHVINDMLYTHKNIIEQGLKDEVEFVYDNLPVYHLGNRAWMIVIKDHYRFEIIEETEDDSGIYRSLTVDSAHILETIFTDLFGKQK